MRSGQYVMGIDGGGSTVRAVIVRPDMTVLAEARGTTANPNIVGPEAASAAIQAAIRDALTTAGINAGQIAAAGIGVAGAAAPRYRTWLVSSVKTVLPGAHIVPSTDYEIALVGALGQHEGVLVLAGTGSLAYGVNNTGDTCLVGGWGYLLGDEGGGYWLGLQGLRAVTRASEGRAAPTSLKSILLAALQIDDPRAIIDWLYQPGDVRTREVAQLAPLVLAEAGAGDTTAGQIVAAAVNELKLATETVMNRLKLAAPKIGFAGGLLTARNPLSTALCDALHLDDLPTPRYQPASGAALLAMLKSHGNTRLIP